MLSFAPIVLVWQISKATCWQLVGEVTCRVETTEKIVALSFDDGPTAEGTYYLLSELGKRQIKATFFLIGKEMAASPDLARQIVMAGHELGNHSYSHRRMIGQNIDHYVREVRLTDALLRDAGARNPHLFRPPFGSRLVGLPRAVARERYRLVTWDVADRVGQHPTPQSYARDIVNRVKPGSIILMHPMYRHNKVERAALPLVLDGLARKGYRIVTVSTLLSLEKSS
jgi:peptidoglycan-N-acetylglucosamine deacetylase